jgi:mannose/fructose/N-acetylgalactosamine-specific phosphotransferase system component IIC
MHLSWGARIIVSTDGLIVGLVVGLIVGETAGGIIGGAVGELMGARVGGAVLGGPSTFSQPDSKANSVVRQTIFS